MRYLFNIYSTKSNLEFNARSLLIHQYLDVYHVEWDINARTFSLFCIII